MQVSPLTIVPAIVLRHLLLMYGRCIRHRSSRHARARIFLCAAVNDLALLVALHAGIVAEPGMLTRMACGIRSRCGVAVLRCLLMQVGSLLDAQGLLSCRQRQCSKVAGTHSVSLLLQHHCQRCWSTAAAMMTDADVVCELSGVTNLEATAFPCSSMFQQQVFLTNVAVPAGYPEAVGTCGRTPVPDVGVPTAHPGHPPDTCAAVCTGHLGLLLLPGCWAGGVAAHQLPAAQAQTAGPAAGQWPGPSQQREACTDYWQAREPFG
jgi:hypothetical protein